MRPAEFVSLTRTDPDARALNYFRRKGIAAALNRTGWVSGPPHAIAEERWSIKAATPALSLGDVDPDATAFFGALFDQSILGKVPLRRWPFGVRTLVGSGIAAGEVAEGTATPIYVPSLSSFRLDERKFQGATVVTQETLETRHESVERGLRDDLLRATADAVDAAFVTDLIAAADSNGFTGDHRYAVYLMHPSDAAANADQRLDVRGGWFRGYPCVTTNALPAGTSILLDASRVAADWTEGEVDIAQQAVLEADTAPAQESAPTPTGPTGEFVSLFQTNSVAIRATMRADWHIGGSVDVVEIAS